MVRSRRLKITVVITLILGAAVLWYWRRCPAEPGRILQVECSHEGGMLANDFWWNLALDAKGNGRLIISPGSTREKRLPIAVPKTITQLQKAVDQWPLCNLPSNIGGAVPDESTDRMRIKTENIDKTITIQFVDPRNADDDVRRIYGLWKVIQDSVDNSTRPN